MDRAALDFALANGFAHGGWCPRGRWAEDGAIPARYQLKKTPSADPAQRTEWNVRDSDATVIFSISAELSGGSLKTAEFAEKHKKAWLHLSLEREGNQASARLLDFLQRHRPQVVNIAGPRQSSEAGAGPFTSRVLEQGLLPYYAG